MPVAHLTAPHAWLGVTSRAPDAAQLTGMLTGHACSEGANLSPADRGPTNGKKVKKRRT